MTVLVTGASGFVGNALCDYLAENGWSVRAASRKGPPVSSRQGIDWVKVGTINGRTDWSEALSGVTHVVHLAAIAHVIGAGGGKDQIRDVNVDGAVRLAQCAARVGVEHFVFLSSIGAITSSSSAPVSERTLPAPDSDYGRSKQNAEEGILTALNGTETRWTILRSPLVYGPGNPGNMARLLRVVRKRIPLPILAIKAKRSFVFIENLVDAIALTLGNPAAMSRTFHVADEEIVSTTDLVRGIVEATGKGSLLFYCPNPMLGAGAWFVDLVRRIGGRTKGTARYSLQKLRESLVVDSSAIRSELGFVQRISMKEGIRKTIFAPPSQLPPLEQ